MRASVLCSWLPVEKHAFLYAGEWINNNPNTNGIPELLITVIGDQLTVHSYGACSPSYCDWGTRTGVYSADPFPVPFDNINSTGINHDLSLSLLDQAGNSLQCVDVGSSSGTNTYDFHKSIIA